jgi:cytochrome c6
MCAVKSDKTPGLIKFLGWKFFAPVLRLISALPRGMLISVTAKGTFTRQRSESHSWIKMGVLAKSIVLVAALLLTVMGVTASLRGESRKTIVAGSAGTPGADAIYRQRCQKCHGTDGTGETSLGKISGAPDFTDSGWWAKHSNNSELVNAITRGRKSMPAFGKKLTRSQITSLAAYVQRFKQ